jgi:hypothetical protein
MSITTDIRAELISAAVQQITGEKPILTKTESYTQISFTEGQKAKLQAFLRNQLEPKPAGDIRIDTMPIIAPVALEKALPYLLGIAAVGFILGRVSR